MVDLKYFGDYTFYKFLFQQSYVEFNEFQHYEKALLLNRSVIPGANGPILLSVPLLGGRNQKTILKEVRIDNGENWQKRHWRSLMSTYNASPWFKYYSDSLSVIFEKRISFLFEWNLNCLDWSIDKLKLPVSYKVVSTAETDLGQVPLREQNRPPEQGGMVRYRQLFEEKTGFIAEVSILDMLFCEGQTQVFASLSSNNR